MENRSLDISKNKRQWLYYVVMGILAAIILVYGVWVYISGLPKEPPLQDIEREVGEYLSDPKNQLPGGDITVIEEEVGESLSNFSSDDSLGGAIKEADEEVSASLSSPE